MACKPGASRRSPPGEQLLGLRAPGGELGVPEDRGLDVGGGDLELGVAGATGLLEQRLPHAGEDLPVPLQRVEVAVGDAAAQVAVDVLDVLGLARVDVARQVEVEVVLRVAISPAAPCASSGAARAGG
jgi:hypothetical protein